MVVGLNDRNLHRLPAERIQLDQAVVGDVSRSAFGQPGYETDLLYLCGIVALVPGGSGPLALDRYLLRVWTKSGVAADE